MSAVSSTSTQTITMPAPVVLRLASPHEQIRKLAEQMKTSGVLDPKQIENWEAQIDVNKLPLELCFLQFTLLEPAFKQTEDLAAQDSLLDFVDAVQEILGQLPLPKGLTPEAFVEEAKKHHLQFLKLQSLPKQEAMIQDLYRQIGAFIQAFAMQLHDDILADFEKTKREYSALYAERIQSSQSLNQAMAGMVQTVEGQFERLVALTEHTAAAYEAYSIQRAQVQKILEDLKKLLKKV